MKGQQINTRFHPGDLRVAKKFAAEWGLTLQEYIRIQATSPAADWRTQRVVFPPDPEFDPAASGYHQVPNGWWKRDGETYWIWIDPEPPADGYSRIATWSNAPDWRPPWEPHVRIHFASGLEVADDGDDA
ncbi:MAG: hypothetical protein OXG43_01575 [Chloroflexi bacterium]|nr:hypothetical protein [Chloroflexota bacterium]